MRLSSSSCIVVFDTLSNLIVHLLVLDWRSKLIAMLVQAESRFLSVDLTDDGMVTICFDGAGGEHIADNGGSSSSGGGCSLCNLDSLS